MKMTGMCPPSAERRWASSMPDIAPSWILAAVFVARKTSCVQKLAVKFDPFAVVGEEGCVDGLIDVDTSGHQSLVRIQNQHPLRLPSIRRLTNCMDACPGQSYEPRCGEKKNSPQTSLLDRSVFVDCGMRKVRSVPNNIDPHLPYMTTISCVRLNSLLPAHGPRPLSRRPSKALEFTAEP